MLDKSARMTSYGKMIDGLSELYRLTEQRKQANPSLNTYQELEKKQDATVEAMVPVALQLICSAIEAHHAIAEALKDHNSLTRTLNSLPVKD